jgi:hypothetical protein
MLRHLLALLLVASAGLAQAQNREDLVPTPRPVPSVSHWVMGPPDPNPYEPNHYRNDTAQPVQERIGDCWFFQAQAWEKPLTDWRHNAAWLCSDIAAKNASGRPLRDSDQAMESLLLAYEAQVRARMEVLLEDWDTHVSIIQQAKPDANPMLPHALVLRSGWLNSPSWHDEVAAEVGLDVVLEALE